MSVYEGALTIGILLMLGLLIYTRLKDQSLRDTYEEIKDLFGFGIENG